MVWAQAASDSNLQFPRLRIQTNSNFVVFFIAVCAKNGCIHYGSKHPQVPLFGNPQSLDSHAAKQTLGRPKLENSGLTRRFVERYFEVSGTKQWRPSFHWTDGRLVSFWSFKQFTKSPTTRTTCLFSKQWLWFENKFLDFIFSAPFGKSHCRQSDRTRHKGFSDGSVDEALQSRPALRR